MIRGSLNVTLICMIIALIFIGCSIEKESQIATSKQSLSYDDVINTLKTNKFKPESLKSQTYFLNNVESKNIKLNNENKLEVFVFKSEGEVQKAHQEFNDKLAISDVLVVPEVFEIKNILIIYYDYKFSKAISELKR